MITKVIDYLIVWFGTFVLAGLISGCVYVLLTFWMCYIFQYSWERLFAQALGCAIGSGIIPAFIMSKHLKLSYDL